MFIKAHIVRENPFDMIRNHIDTSVSVFIIKTPDSNCHMSNTGESCRVGRGSNEFKEIFDKYTEHKNNTLNNIKENEINNGATAGAYSLKQCKCNCTDKPKRTRVKVRKVTPRNK